MLASATYALAMWRSLWNGGKYMCVDTPALCKLLLKWGQSSRLGNAKNTMYTCMYVGDVWIVVVFSTYTCSFSL